MKIKRILAAALAAMTLGLTITGCSNNGGNGSTEDDTIVIGLDVGFAPMGFEQDGEIVGFDIDLARAVIEDKMGKNVEFQPIDWNSKEGELNTGKVDLLWNGLSRSPEREENMALTNSYLKNDQILVVKSDSGITSSADITGKVLAMQEGSTAEDAWDTFSEEHTDIVPSTVNLLSDNVVCLTELEQDKADVVLMDSVVAEYYLSTNDEYSNLTIQTGWQHCFAFPREIFEKDGKICQRPIRELEEKKHLVSDVKGMLAGEGYPVYEMTISDITKNRFKVILSEKLILDYADGKFRMHFTDQDKTSVSSGRSMRYVEVEEVENLKILADTSSVEVFVNDGEYVFSTRYYPEVYKLQAEAVGAQITLSEIM